MNNHWELGGTLDLGTYPKNERMQFSPSDLDNEANWKKVKSKSIWAEDSFDYKYNAQGFRSEWDFDPSIDKPILLALGCSHTVGVGIPGHDAWCHQLGKKYYSDHIVWNAGLGGGGADTVARLAVNMIPIAKPKTVAILWPGMYRYERYPSDQRLPFLHGPWQMDKQMIDDKNIYNNQCKNKTIIQLLQKIYQFELLELDVDHVFDNNTKLHHPVDYPLARDGAHSGSEWHIDVQEAMWSKYQ